MLDPKLAVARNVLHGPLTASSLPVHVVNPTPGGLSAPGVSLSAEEEHLERQIQAAYEAFNDCSTREEKGYHFRVMASFVAQRSKDLIERMEREKGLR